MSMDFEAVLDEFESRHDTDSTAERYVRNVRKWREWLQAEIGISVWEAETADLREWVRDFEKNDLAPSTINQRVSAVSRFYQESAKMAESKRYDMPDVPENPYEGFDKQDRKMLRGDTKKAKGIAENKDGISYLSPEQVETLENHVPAPKLRNQLFLRLMFNCGLRREELAKIKFEHLDRDDNSIHIPARKSPKPRVVTYSESYIGFHLSRWLDHGGRDAMTYAAESDYLFPTNKGEHISPDYINQVVKEAAESAGLQETVNEYADGRQIRAVTSHTLRHSYAVQAIKSGIDVRTLQSLLGHEQLETTEIYLKLAEDDVKEASRDFNPTPHTD